MIEPDNVLRILRNPWGHTQQEIVAARLQAVDEIERLRRRVADLEALVEAARAAAAHKKPKEKKR